eukprot:489058-Hanusia_phi.AAC.1
MANDYNDYVNHILPKIQRVKRLKHLYQLWSSYNEAHMTVLAKELVDDVLPHIQQLQFRDLYTQNIHKQRKLNIQTEIKDIESQLHSLNNDLVRQQEALKLQLDHKQQYLDAVQSLQRIQDDSAFLKIISSEFKNYKKWIYETQVLNKIVSFANHIILLASHPSSKPFQLKFLIGLPDKN